MRALACVALALAFGSVGCGLGYGSVTRVYSGKPVEGRYIAPEAYAHFTQAAIFEAQGDDGAAADEYRRALAIDPENPDGWTRLGAVSCERDRAAADAAFSAAESLDEDYAPLWRERARCALQHGDAKSALTWAKRAVLLDPDDEAASLAIAEAERRRGHLAEARRWLIALSVRDPGSLKAKDALASLDAKVSGEALHRPSSAPPAARATLNDVDRALIEATPERARKLALAAGLSRGQLALRAAALGRSALARAEAERVLAADPDDSDAWIAGLYAATLEGDRAEFERVSRALGAEPLPPSSLGLRLLSELFARRLGPGEKDALLSAWGPLPDPSDELERRVQARSKSQ